MSEQERELALFNLGKSLVELLGEEQAIADLNLLYERHPEMFRDKQEVKEVIEKVVNEPEIIVDATHSNKDIGIFKALKKLDNEKMGDIVIKNDSGTNVIYHANKKSIAKLAKFKKEGQILVEASSAKAAPTRSNHYASKSFDLPKCNKAPSISATEIIPQSNNIPSTSKLSLLKSQAQENSRNQESRNTDSMISVIQSKEELLLEMNKENKERELKEEENNHTNTRTMR
ncbi:hypothetical protein [Helicobacter pullorum]|uniref:hypothetical protein n=1 Tax=Helicobacter pullorum TaxID=35818 RepID=UPI0006BB0B14|nr:hypothetical protein [Helicobacter pullorum]